MTDTLTLNVPDGVYSEVPGWSGMIRHPEAFAMTAGAYPVTPPSSWFDDPGLTSLTPLTVDDDGRVFGHIAAWHTSHIGMAGGVKPPRSKSNYAYYQTGVVKCDDGKMVNVGQITLTGGHAPLNAGVSKAVAHYDDTASAIMDVAAGEDKHGIWVAGALRPDVTEAQLRSIRASSVSGDWRPINGKLELVAVCAVNAPGFPIPRARVASGAPIALVAAGTEPLIELAMNDRIQASVEVGIAAGLELFRERILRLENTVLAADASQEEPKPEVDPDQLRKRVRGGSALAASLRERVRGGGSLVSTATSAWDTEKRDKAADSGVAMEDGSYPIADKEDLRKAIQAFGRASDKEATKRHIIKRARALDAVGDLPEDWNVTASAGTSEEVKSLAASLRERVKGTDASPKV